ncbi:hypothetical protein U9M48_025654 [Paspalum notatum var. saurae]|uniref:Uncharacterized protein n=1 Tax=Paspalum notatum var. saurae TaxID=547442 RepID=A0AAQ3TQU9_PASNO
MQELGFGLQGDLFQHKAIQHLESMKLEKWASNPQTVYLNLQEAPSAAVLSPQRQWRHLLWRLVPFLQPPAAALSDFLGWHRGGQGFIPTRPRSRAHAQSVRQSKCFAHTILQEGGQQLGCINQAIGELLLQGRVDGGGRGDGRVNLKGRVDDVDVVRSLPSVMTGTIPIPPPRRALALPVHRVAAVELAATITAAKVASAVSLVVAVLAIMAPPAAPAFKVRVVVVVAAPDSTLLLLLVAPSVALVAPLVALLPRWWWVVREVLERATGPRLSVDHPQIPAREPPDTWSDVALFVPRLDSVHNDTVLAAGLPVFRQRLHHQNRRELGIPCLAGETQPDLLRDGARVRSPGPQVHRLGLVGVDEVCLDGLQCAAPGDDALDDVRIPGMVRDTVKAELDPVQESNSQGRAQAAPSDEANVDAAALGVALLDGYIAVVRMLELDEEGLRMMSGDRDFAWAQLELLAQHRFNLLGAR